MNINEKIIEIIRTAIALLLMIPCSVLIGIIYIAHKLTVKDGGPFLYKGQRLGKDKKIFYMYKIRTLSPNAEKKLHGVLHKDGSNMELPIGPFLRKTRLDEIPQIFNILKGDMAFVGPRPVRPSVYITQCQNIPNYDNRFKIRPGLTGLSQFLTPHNTSKMIRSRIDNLMVQKVKNPFWCFYMMTWTASVLLKKLFGETYRFSSKLAHKLSNEMIPHPVTSDVSVKEHLNGISLRETCPTFKQTNDHAFSLVDVKNEDFHITTRKPLEKGDELHLVITHNQNKRNINIKCKAVVNEVHDDPLKESLQTPSYSIKIEPVSDLNEFKMNRYILKQSYA